MTDSRSMLAFYAHPDDEQGVSGTLRMAVEQGIRTGLICATRGEVGQIHDPALATRETLGAVREEELRRACAVLGVHEVHFLDYRDSGMIGSPENNDPRAFIRANAEEAVGRIVRQIRAFKPTIVITFDESGVYGHPDHLAIHRFTTDAFHAAGDAARYPDLGAPFQPRRLYYASVSRMLLVMFDTMLKEMNIPSIFSGVDVNTMGLPDEQITHRIDVARYVALKRESLEAHRTQHDPNGPFSALPEETWNEVRSIEVYGLAAGDPLPVEYDPQDLFAGLG